VKNIVLCFFLFLKGAACGRIDESNPKLWRTFVTQPRKKIDDYRLVTLTFNFVYLSLIPPSFSHMHGHVVFGYPLSQNRTRNYSLDEHHIQTYLENKQENMVKIWLWRLILSKLFKTSLVDEHPIGEIQVVMFDFFLFFLYFQKCNDQFRVFITFDH
jgi:hypothetical protein